MRALANHERLTLKILAASFAVSSTIIGVGFCAAAPPVREDCEVLS
jgi:hypothetical protein